jgi:hypothetical protein
MKRQINYALILLFLFLVWLFTNTAVTTYKHLIQERDNTPRYQMVSTGDNTPAMIYDKMTGETWQHIKVKSSGGDVTDEAWARVYYKDAILPGEEGVSEIYSVTPADIMKRQRKSVREWVQKYKGSADAIGKAVEIKNLPDLLEEETAKKK